MTLAPTRNLGLQNLTSVWRVGSGAAQTLAFLIAGGAFSLQLSGLDPHAPVGADSASMLSNLATGSALAVLMLFGAAQWRRVLSLMGANAPLLALPALAILSVLWAPEPLVALRRAAAFALTVLAGFAVVARSPGASALRFLIRAATTAVLLSIVYLALSPGYGAHQWTDGVQSVHAGDWRGLFVHRTALGQLAALALGLAIYAGAEALSRALQLCVIFGCLLCLFMAHSGGGWVSAAILLALPSFWIAGRRLALWNGPLAAAIAVAVLALSALLAPMLISVALQALGKDPTLTGRTDLWRLMAQQPVRNPGSDMATAPVFAQRWPH